MSDDAPRKEEEVSAGPRMLPAVIIAGVYAVVLILALRAPTLVGNAMGVAIAPLLATVALAIWWIRSRGVPKKDRWLGLAIFAGANVLLVVMNGSDIGVRLLMIALPILTFGLVGMLLATAGMSWPQRRKLAVAYMVLCTAIFSASRVDDVGGDIVPELAWRWSESAEDNFASSGLGKRQDSYETAALPAKLEAGDWAEFRGPERDSRLTGVTFATDWDANPPKELWRHPVGLGWSSFAAVGDYLFTQEQRGEDEVVVCYEANTGEEVWANWVAARFEESMGSGPRATPTYDDGDLFVQGATGILQRLDAATGEAKWQRDLKTDTGAKIPVWGFASSPLVVDNLVIVFSGAGEGKGVVAYERDTGEPAWFAGAGTHGYVSGQLVRIHGVPQVLFSSDMGIESFAPESGEILWEHSWPINTNPRCVQPIVVDESFVLIGTAGGKGTRSLSIAKDGDSWIPTEEWTTRRFRPYYNDSVLHEGKLYGFDGSMLVCVDAATGERLWKGSKFGGQVLLIADMDMLLVLSEKGEVILFEASPDGDNEIARFKALKGKTWNHPVIADGKLYVRNSAEAACFELARSAAAS